MGKSKLLSIVVAALLLFFLIYQLYAVFYNPISTEIVTQYTATDGVDITGIVIRDEELIEFSSAKSLHFEVDDAGRVAKNGVIAAIYENEAQSVNATRIKELEKEIANIEEIQKYNDQSAVDINLINSKIFSNLDTFIANAGTGNFKNIGESKSTVLTLMNRKQIATGQAVDFGAQISSLKKELASVKTAVGSPSGYIRAKKSGYFVSMADGYENLLNTGMLDSVTPEFLDNLKVEQPKSGVIGKLVSNYNWYIAASVSINDSLLFKIGEKLTVKTPLKSNPEITVEVHSINMSPSSDRAVIILSCQEMSGELSSVRSTAMTIVRKTYTGLKVSSKALRMVDTDQKDENGFTVSKPTTGVYTVSGMAAHFVPVNILYSEEGFAICEYAAEDGSLKLYDEIVVNGKNMYEGKVIN